MWGEADEHISDVPKTFHAQGTAISSSSTCIQSLAEIPCRRSLIIHAARPPAKAMERDWPAHAPRASNPPHELGNLGRKCFLLVVPSLHAFVRSLCKGHAFACAHRSRTAERIRGLAPQARCTRDPSKTQSQTWWAQRSCGTPIKHASTRGGAVARILGLGGHTRTAVRRRPYASAWAQECFRLP